MLDAGRWVLDAGWRAGEDVNGLSVAFAKTPCFFEDAKLRPKTPSCLRPLLCRERKKTRSARSGSAAVRGIRDGTLRS
jgi:hypothetical protein